MEIKVSIIIPTHNRAHFIGDALRSVQEQSLTEWECIIVDDGSTDGTKQIVEGFLWDKRFKYTSLPANISKGANSARNYGFELSNGKYIQWLDDDDKISKNKLEYQITAMEADKRNCFTVCPWDYFWPSKKMQLIDYFRNKRIINSEDYFQTLAANQSFIPANAFLIPKELCKKAGGWRKDLSLNDDAEYVTRIFINSEGLLNVANCFALYRNHSEERLSRQMDRKSLNSFLISLECINFYLKNDGVKAEKFFKWKLLKIINNYRGIDPKLLKKHEPLFKEYGIYLRFYRYYNMKHSIYLVLFPIFKKIKKLTR
ncbi:glycosyltransferase family 2 protein [Salinimicrobium sediminilitoris]|uniref:glycosyltransferase family 2 protein n=1 Tax=Salinimicrobium sediminilitoris TaxID=2876715 RepID=UPI001E469D01|nr:glycosyltransferase family 2 protein [Salinimicrobium sediminilitoris]MCC8358527.1 glycosyltransferase [Salinimicrobium sediminilitoris]